MLLFLACKPHHIKKGKTARKDVKKKSDFYGKGDINIIV